MRYEGDKIRAPDLFADVDGDQLVLLGRPRVGFGVWAINLPEGVEVQAAQLNEQLIVEGFDFPAGQAMYGNKLYLRNTTPVVHTLHQIATVSVIDKRDEKAPTPKKAEAKAGK